MTANNSLVGILAPLETHRLGVSQSSEKEYSLPRA
jgi:hypothetical protein